MDFFSGLEQFGLKVEDADKEIYGEEARIEREKEAMKNQANQMVSKTVSESEFLFTKHIRCPICEKVFPQKTVKNARIKRMQPDVDLRPRFQYIDTLKYDICSCPYCGYTAMTRFFEGINKAQSLLIKENISSKFQPGILDEAETYDYDTAISRYKLSLYNSIVKKAKTSEKAYTCLKISWLYRAMVELLEEEEKTEENLKKTEECKTLEEQFYKEAFDGFDKAMAVEDFPMCGMDSFTLDYMMAAMACHFKDFSYASKSLGNILRSQVADRRIKDKAMDLRDYIREEIKKNAGM